MITETQQIYLEGVCLDLRVKNIKNIHLRVCPPEGKVSISAPIHVSLDALKSFVASKLSWIKKHQSRFLKQPGQRPKQYLSNESHYCKGKKYLLNVIYCKGLPKVEIREQSYIDLYVRPNSNLEQRRRITLNWYRQQLKDSVPALVLKWQKILGVKLNGWGVKRMKTRWGTCNIRTKWIWLNLELIKKPEHCLEYLIVHEMVHLLERKHNSRYRAYLDKFMPQWRQYKEELKPGFI